MNLIKEIKSKYILFKFIKYIKKLSIICIYVCTLCQDTIGYMLIMIFGTSQ